MVLPIVRDECEKIIRVHTLSSGIRQIVVGLIFILTFALIVELKETVRATNEESIENQDDLSPEILQVILG